MAARVGVEVVVRGEETVVATVVDTVVLAKGKKEGCGARWWRGRGGGGGGEGGEDGDGEGGGGEGGTCSGGVSDDGGGGRWWQ